MQYRPSEKKIDFGLKVPSIDGLSLSNYMIEIGKKYFNELLKAKKGQNKSLNVGDSSILLSKNRKKFQEKQQEASMYS